MRHVLAPIPILETCNLSEAVRWIQYRAYPIPDEDVWSYQDAVNYFADSEKIIPYWGDEPGAKERRDECREELYVRLRVGRLAASGEYVHRIPVLRSAQSETVGTIWVEDAGPREPGAEIPADAWNAKRINWQDSRLEVPPGMYLDAFLRTDDLFREFHELPVEGKRIMEIRGGNFCMETDQAAPEKRGPKPKFDWPQACLEFGMHRKGELPEKQSAFELEMQQWFLKRYGTAPSIQAIRRYVAPLYERRR